MSANSKAPITALQPRQASFVLENNMKTQEQIDKLLEEQTTLIVEDPEGNLSKHGPVQSEGGSSRRKPLPKPLTNRVYNNKWPLSVQSDLSRSEDSSTPLCHLEGRLSNLLHDQGGGLLIFLPTGQET
ncbi:uncharacterized protein LOC143766405 [Ranitomeya variabilis]|uniref:uncharacterized protein LOC143766405 n=1 Tax=Ranitomeya variabilis TaxID=490064 RepID=UPI004057C426